VPRGFSSEEGPRRPRCQEKPRPGVPSGAVGVRRWLVQHQLASPLKSPDTALRPLRPAPPSQRRAIRCRTRPVERDVFGRVRRVFELEAVCIDREDRRPTPGDELRAGAGFATRRVHQARVLARRAGGSEQTNTPRISHSYAREGTGVPLRLEDREPRTPPIDGRDFRRRSRPPLAPFREKIGRPSLPSSGGKRVRAGVEERFNARSVPFYRISLVVLPQTR
jgi:hypothetical protein